MEKFAFRKIELWIVATLIVLLLLLMFAFGVAVRHVANGGDELGIAGETAYAIASLPAEVSREWTMLMRDDSAGMSTNHSDRFPGRGGWTFQESRLSGGLGGYLLFSRHDGDAGHHVLELVDLTSGDIKHRIDLDADLLFARASRTSRFTDAADWTRSRFRAIHPLPLDNGDILVKGHRTPLVRMTPCGEPVWVLDKNLFHHTTELGPDGNFWSTTWIEPQRVPGLRADFLDPGIVEFDADGHILFDRSFTDVLLKNGLGHLILASEHFSDDPLHLNDVQPVFEDGPYWRRGDVFVSLRHISAIMLYRPSTDEIVWSKQGPWAAQHDVDVIDDHTISVFNNNAYNFGNGMFVDGHSDIMFYDFATDTVTSPYKDVLVANDFRTEAEGSFTLLPGGHLYLDEAESGRTLMFSPGGELEVENVNRARNGLIYHLGWSRYLDRAAGDRLLARLEAAKCD